MSDRVRAGTILIQDGTPTPAGMVVTTQRYSAGWSSITNFTSAQLGREVEMAGWTFFYMAGELRTSGFGFNEKSRTDRAVTHLIAVVKRQHCNCLEIDEIRLRSFLGLPYTSVVAHARHIQKSRSFYGSSGMPVGTPLRPSGSRIDQPVLVQSPFSLAGESIEAWENEGGSRAESSPATVPSFM
jgi:hypothetical protein